MIPDIIRESPPLAEAHRLDLALFVVLEETAVSAAESLLRAATDAAARTFLARQAEDDGRHLDDFRRRLDQSLAVRSSRADATQALLLRVLQTGGGTADALRREEVVAAVVVPPLRRFLDRCRAAADAGSFVEALALLDLVLKGTASPLSAFEVRFWEPVDPFLARLIRAADEDDRQHVRRAAALVRSLAANDATLVAICAEARATLSDAFRYYARKLVALFAAVRRQHAERYAGVEMVFAASSPEEQVAVILSAGEAGCAQALRLAGLDRHG